MTVQELIDALRDNCRVGYSPVRGYDQGVLGGDHRATRMEGSFDLEAVVRIINAKQKSPGGSSSGAP